jgi:hypothetical protein
VSLIPERSRSPRTRLDRVPTTLALGWSVPESFELPLEDCEQPFVIRKHRAVRPGFANREKFPVERLQCIQDCRLGHFWDAPELSHRFPDRAAPGRTLPPQNETGEGGSRSSSGGWRKLLHSVQLGIGLSSASRFCRLENPRMHAGEDTVVAASSRIVGGIVFPAEVNKEIGR